MGLVIERERNYGADIDGNRGEDTIFYSFESDISGKELSYNELYYYGGELMSLNELMRLDLITDVGGLIYSEILDMSFTDFDEYVDCLEREFKIDDQEYIEREKREIIDEWSDEE